MKNWGVLFAAALAAMLVSAPAVASRPPTRMLVNMCRDADANKTTMCGVWILGEVDGAEQAMILNRGKALFCMPQAAGPDEKIAVVTKYMHDHPESMSQDLGKMVVSALMQAYPCGRRH